MFGTGYPTDPLEIRTPAGFPFPWNAKGSKVLRDQRGMAGRRVLVLHIMGQSNSANMTETPYVPDHADRIHNLNVMDGGFYSGADPWLGATGDGGHWLGQCADALIDLEACDDVVWVTYGVGGTNVQQWANGGELNHRLLAACRRVQDAGLTNNAFIWVLGESGEGTPEPTYRANLQSVIATPRAIGFNSPWIIGTSTYHNGIINPTVRQANVNVLNGVDILAGVDTDGFALPTYRQDQGGAWVHLNRAAADIIGPLWAQNIASYGLI